VRSITRFSKDRSKTADAGHVPTAAAKHFPRTEGAPSHRRRRAFLRRLLHATPRRSTFLSSDHEELSASTHHHAPSSLHPLHPFRLYRSPSPPDAPPTAPPATMRYLDWDVLLFPHASHIPIKEFRVACYLQQERLDSAGVPILTAFVPSLPDHTPFQVSVHSWIKPQAILGGNNAGYAPGTAYQWRVNVRADGKVLSSETFAEDVTWPKQIGTSPCR